MFQDIDEFIDNIQPKRFGVAITAENGETGMIAKNMPFEKAKELKEDLEKQYKDEDTETVDTPYTMFVKDKIISIDIALSPERLRDDRTLTEGLEGETITIGLMPPYMDRDRSGIAISEKMADEIHLDNADEVVIEWVEDGEKYRATFDPEIVHTDTALNDLSLAHIDSTIKDKTGLNLSQKVKIRSKIE